MCSPFLINPRLPTTLTFVLDAYKPYGLKYYPLTVLL